MHNITNGPKVIGTKQTLRALNKGIVETIYVAKDAQKQITLRAQELAQSQDVPIVFIDSMEELAKACHVEVKTATAALIKN
ncbi:large subunit ribosomal protein L7A [Natranaerovirga hydrolytica]|uniref:Large subunit ribosomal protein L7A n=1 Tax=Natranaerovirga hydrolytica TaxID=680378 RepID=A0A4R1MKP3_9FIRM|nr:ribosomal L7Ae/L30e/S12e/Gadd45 family protein [Natranaerovirga hydrolytica]TCK93408.1 large subunit ribosomal protein L7A [Natranaerovirga hydrolytica]